MSILFNLSQYLYYGEDYYQAIFDEYQPRDFATYSQSIQNATDQLAHAILTTI
jgi:hypothetical protein